MTYRRKVLNKFVSFVGRQAICTSNRNLMFYLNYLFQDILFDEKLVIDIGGGCGLYSIYAACMGAKYSICLEPGLDGSRKDSYSVFRRLSASLPINNVDFRPVRFQDFDPQDQKFDIILLHNSINHLDEEACTKLHYDDDARKRYGLIFQKLSKIASPKAKLILADCSRHNFFALLNLRNPFAPTIRWHNHQSPELWSQILSNYSFANPKIHWTSPSFLGKIGRLLFGNRLMSYFLTSHFVLVMDKAHV